MNLNRGLNTRWANTIILFRLHCFEQLPFNNVDDIAEEVLVSVTAARIPIYINEASIGRSFSDQTVNVLQMRSVVQRMLLRYTVAETISAPPAAPSGVIHLSVDLHDDEAPPLVDWDSDEASEPYDSDSGSDSDPGMPPLIDLYDSDSGYGSN
ncbi:hypothetical protein C8J56DRAFT_891813 [Mycena floridula]|nr:hypothetical protein C8J56DRAFT_891813 [Mycena floridula]